MKTDTEIRTTGLQLLIQGLGRVEAERFISLILREPFDYTKWQRDLWNDKTVQDLSTEAMRLRSESK
jgi:hypothetical protein